MRSSFYLDTNVYRHIVEQGQLGLSELISKNRTASA